MSNKNENTENHGKFSVIFSVDPSMDKLLTKSHMPTKTKLAHIITLMDEGVKVAGHDGLALSFNEIKEGSIIIELAGLIISSGVPFNLGCILCDPLMHKTKISLMDIIQYFCECQNNLNKSGKFNIHDIISEYFYRHSKVSKAINALITSNNEGHIIFKSEIFLLKMSWNNSRKITISKKRQGRFVNKGPILIKDTKASK